MSYQPFGSPEPYYPSYGDPSYATPDGAPCGPRYEDAPCQYASSTLEYSDPAASSKSPKRSTEYSTYFLPGFGLSRQVIFSRYQLHLGPSATIRPFSYQQREGYMITNAGKPLTQTQIEDLKSLSLDYEQKEANRMVSRTGSKGQQAYVNEPIPVQQRRHYTPEY